MADIDLDDIDYGDESRRNGDYIGLPHDQDESNVSSTGDNNVSEGQAVHIDAQGNIAAAAAGEAVVGVLYTYQYYYDPSSGDTIKQDENATVKTGGAVKAEVESTVSAGDPLEAGVTTNGVFDTSDATDSEQANFIALSDARQQDRDGATTHYAEVLIR